MQVLIKSNPYEQKIDYMYRLNENNDWKDIAEGELYTEALKKGFFPFVIEKVLDAVITQFRNDKKGKIGIIFAGPDDEYNELVQAISGEYYKRSGSSERIPYLDLVELVKSDEYLENARDILPEIKKVYKQRISPLITVNLSDQSAIQSDLNKFTEASDDIIPICVIGNYSSGKSTFINALLGNEVLPSADRPTTAKYFKITNSKQSDRATIDFDYNNEYVSIRFNGVGYKFTSGKSDDDLVSAISDKLNQIKDADIVLRVNKTIEILNDYEKKKEEHCISDLISLSVPFGKGIWGEASSNFTIIDTPGSNTASNLDHKNVLNAAMEGLTNGLPIFVSKYDSLDTDDNLSLFALITNMKELDTRFTILAVNQADVARIPKDGFSENDIDDIQSQAVPKNLKSTGIFFVSSIMGLGAKNNGEFWDDGYAETYDGSKEKFTNPESRFYRQLYKYNIMPERMKTQADEEMKTQDNLLWANSGILSVEHEIKTFSEKYSHYNKCQQSEMFLGKVIRISEEQLENERIKHSELKVKREQELEEDKRNLIKLLSDKSEELRDGYFKTDEAPIDELINAKMDVLKNVDIQAKEDEFTSKNRKINDIKGVGDNLSNAFNSIGNDITSNLTDIFKNKKYGNIKNIGTDFVSDISKTISGVGDWLSTSKKIERDTAIELVQHMDQLYKDDSRAMQDEIYKTSVDFWDSKCEEIKNVLAKIVHETDVLTDEERDNIASAIIDFEKLSILEMPDIIFAKSDFDHAIRILNWRIDLSDKIKLDKLSHSFDAKLTENVNIIKRRIIEDHESKFRDWLYNLNEEITTRIVELNPTLHGKYDEIQIEEEKIQNLTKLKDNLNFYQRSIEDMMTWKRD